MGSFKFLIFFIAFTLDLMVFHITDIHAQDQKPGEYQVKAAFLYNIAKFVQWSGMEADEFLTLGILGEDPFSGTLDGLEGKVVQGKKLLIQRFRSYRELRKIHMLFISPKEKENLSQILQAVKGSEVLLVGDTEGFAQKGVCINFYLEQQKVRFEINVDAARRAGLKISSNLLKLAKIVHDSK
jgi:hypothetical protein